MKDQYGCAAFQGTDLNVLPTNSAAPSGLKCFQRRFFCRKPRGIMLGRHRAAAFTVQSLRLRIHALGKTWRASQHFANSRDFDNVYSNGNDHF